MPEAHIPAPVYLELRIVTRERRSCVRRRTEIINRLK
ncbi:MAG: hypothetical protein ACI8X5_002060, partial [Planctomycetota bacterium]